MSRAAAFWGFVLALVTYEFVAVLTPARTFTELIESAPDWVELFPVIGGVIGLAAILWHFGWLTKGDRPPFGTRVTTSPEGFCRCGHDQNHHTVEGYCRFIDCDCGKFERYPSPIEQ